jgi:Protein of unknown function (DUF2630)
MDDSTVLGKIEELVAEEQSLLRPGGGQGDDSGRQRRLEEIGVELDRCWDLLRQRRAREEFAQDPDTVHVRDADTVERYMQ